jgi:hypothetical protein
MRLAGRIRRHPTLAGKLLVERLTPPEKPH